MQSALDCLNLVKFSMSDTNEKKEEDKFNETLKRMLKTPPKPHDGEKVDNDKRSSQDTGKTSSD